MGTFLNMSRSFSLLHHQASNNFYNLKETEPGSRESVILFVCKSCYFQKFRPREVLKVCAIIIEKKLKIHRLLNKTLRKYFRQLFSLVKNFINTNQAEYLLEAKLEEKNNKISCDTFFYRFYRYSNMLIFFFQVINRNKELGITNLVTISSQVFHRYPPYTQVPNLL